MSHESKVTTNHEEIKRWVEERNGIPAMVIGTEHGDTGVLRIDFPGFSGDDSLEEISWDKFFQVFDDRELAFLYQDTTADGETSRFFKLVNREA